MDYFTALGNEMSPSTLLNGCEINVRFYFLGYIKKQFQFIGCIINVRIGSLFNVQCNNMQYLNSFLSCSVGSLTLASVSCLFTTRNSSHHEYAPLL